MWNATFCRDNQIHKIRWSSMEALDAEHPTVIPMDVSTSPTTALGPMTRARAKAIEDKVNSLLSELPLSTHASWLLPQAETLCVIMYLEEGHGTTTSNGQDGEDTKYEGQEEELQEELQPSDDCSRPDVRSLKATPTRGSQASERYSGRTSVQDWMTDNSQRPEVRAPPKIRQVPNRMTMLQSLIPSRMDKQKGQMV
ncbi:hypothetical protein ACQJBY_042676 [Aegilops geniculata]